MCIYTVKNQNLKKKLKNYQRGGVRNSTERPKTRRLRRKRYGKNSQRLRHVMLHTVRI